MFPESPAAKVKSYAPSTVLAKVSTGLPPLPTLIDTGPVKVRAEEKVTF